MVFLPVLLVVVLAAEEDVAEDVAKEETDPDAGEAVMKRGMKQANK